MNGKTVKSSIAAIVCAILLGGTAAHISAQDSRERQEEYLRQSLRIMEPADFRASVTSMPNHRDATWYDWQKRTGELPPDFAVLPSTPDLPNPLEWEGHPVTTREQWDRKRDWIRAQYQYWISGHRPPAPSRVTPRILEERVEPGGVRVQLIELRFGPDERPDACRMTVELLIPPGEGPFPVYMTQWNHRGWAQLALNRGYIGCRYAGSDDKDDTENYELAYPEYDFTCLMRRAWGASRVVDYLVTRPDVDARKIAITGHSRNGKQSLWAAAFDERFAAVVTSSCGTGGMTPYRYTDPQYCSQTLDNIAANAAHWFQPRLRYFFGREDKLPVDQNLLLSLIAPRPLLMHYSYVENQLNPWACEQCYQSVKTVYDFLDAGDRLGIFPRMGEHAVATRDLERCLDFLDMQFGRRNFDWQNRLFYDMTFAKWRSSCGRNFSPDAFPPPKPISAPANHATVESLEHHQREIRQTLRQLLGEKPPQVRAEAVTPTVGNRMDWIDRVTGRPQIDNAARLDYGPYSAMGDHLSGYLYCPKTADLKSPETRLPVVIFLHQYSYAHGSAYGYRAGNCDANAAIFREFVADGFAVLAIDMIGFGTRIEEGAGFYERFPRWSKMGKMVDDVQACLDAIEQIPFLDPQRVSLVGNTIGGTVALLAAALDERVASVAVVAGMSPWRDADFPLALDSVADRHAFWPQLGCWRDRPEQIPVDFPEIIACLAPRPVLIIAPTLDRHAHQAAVAQTVDEARAAYESLGHPERLSLSTPEEINRMTREMQAEILHFLATNTSGQ